MQEDEKEKIKESE